VTEQVHTINPWNLRFSSAEIERSFRETRDERTLNSRRLALVLALILYAAFGLFDALAIRSV
jgi:hypothetical protein